jgi:hypothetical protein
VVCWWYKTRCICIPPPIHPFLRLEPLGSIKPLVLPIRPYLGNVAKLIRRRRISLKRDNHPQNPSVKSMALPALATATSAHHTANRANATSPQRSVPSHARTCAHGQADTRTRTRTRTRTGTRTQAHANDNKDALRVHAHEQTQGQTDTRTRTGRDTSTHTHAHQQTQALAHARTHAHKRKRTVARIRACAHKRCQPLPGHKNRVFIR